MAIRVVPIDREEQAASVKRYNDAQAQKWRVTDDCPPSPTLETLRYVESVVAKRGRPPSGKVVVSLRLDPDIISAFRATGPGWQARINEALRKAKP